MTRRNTAQLIAAARALQVLPAANSPAPATAQPAPALAQTPTVDETPAAPAQVAQPKRRRKPSTKPSTEGPDT